MADNDTFMTDNDPTPASPPFDPTTAEPPTTELFLSRGYARSSSQTFASCVRKLLAAGYVGDALPLWLYTLRPSSRRLYLQAWKVWTEGRACSRSIGLSTKGQGLLRTRAFQDLASGKMKGRNRRDMIDSLQGLARETYEGFPVEIQRMIGVYVMSRSIRAAIRELVAHLKATPVQLQHMDWGSVRRPFRWYQGKQSEWLVTVPLVGKGYKTPSGKGKDRTSLERSVLLIGPAPALDLARLHAWAAPAVPEAPFIPQAGRSLLPMPAPCIRQILQDTNDDRLPGWLHGLTVPPGPCMKPWV